MITSNGTITSPNPYTSTVLVPSNDTYVTVGCLAALLWDIFLHIPQDYQLATQYRVNVFFGIYWIARLATLVFVLGVIIMSTAEVEQCHYFRLVAMMYPIAVPLTVLPFVMRVFALYRNNKFVVAFFSMTWLSVLGTCIAMPIDIASTTTGARRYCLHRLVSPVSLWSCLFVHESLIFVATSWALMRNSYLDFDLGVKKGIRVRVLGKHLRPLSRAILRDGQAYYMIVLIFSVVYLPLPGVRTQCTVIAVLLSNMSSYVYRNLRLGVYQDPTLSTSAIDRVLDGIGPTKSAQQSPGLVFQHPTLSMEHSEDGDLEAGDIGKAEGGEEELGVTGSRKSFKENSLKYSCYP